jgi:hypothetical protein
MTTDELLALVATGMTQVTGRPAPALTLDADIGTRPAHRLPRRAGRGRAAAVLP